jgi:proliferating cell nuclear antigen
MKLKIEDVKFIKDPITIISDMVAEATFKISNDMLELVAMDPGSIAMVIFRIMSSAFSEYVPGEEKSISINLNRLKQVLRRSKPSDVVTLETEKGKLKILLEGKAKRKFYLPLIDTESAETRTPSLSFTSTVTTDSDNLKSAIEDVDIIGESVSFTIKEDNMIVGSRDDLSEANIEITKDETTKIVSTEEVKASFSIEYLKKMIKGSDISNVVKIEMANDHPIKISYTVLNKMNLEFILAPRFEDN